MTHANDAPALDRIAAGVLLTLLMLFARCSQCRAQEHFRFNTSTVVMVDTTGHMDVGSASWPVIASSDTLYIGCPTLPLLWHGIRWVRMDDGCPTLPLLWHGIRWVRMDDGSFHYLTPYFQAHYIPGPGGQSLYVRPMGAIREIEFYERPTAKL